MVQTTQPSEWLVDGGGGATVLGDGGAAASGRRRRWRLVAAEQQDWIRISRMAQIITRLRGVLGGRTNQWGSGRQAAWPGGKGAAGERWEAGVGE
jgi:hypothetical protein